MKHTLRQLLRLSDKLDHIGRVELADEIRLAVANLMMESESEVINTYKTIGVVTGGLVGTMLGGVTWVPLTVVGYAGGRWLGRRVARLNKSTKPQIGEEDE